MRNIWIVLKKELKKFLGNKRMFFGVIILPGLLIFALYSIMGKALDGRFDGSSETYQVAILEGAPDEYINLLPKSFTNEFIKKEDESYYKDLIYNGNYDLYIVFPSNFPTTKEDIINTHEVLTVGIYYNPSENTSSEAYTIASTILNSYHSYLMQLAYDKDAIFNINPDTSYELYDKQKADGLMVSMILPFILIVMLVSAGLSVTPESISGEKERGTLATILVTDVKRYEIALGKILALSIIASLSGLSSFIGTLSSMPTLMGTTQVNYSVLSILMLLFIVISTVIMITAILSIISAYARNVKEATTLSSPLSILSMLCGVSTMFSSKVPTNNLIYFVPILNSTNALAQILSYQINYLNLGITVIANLLYTLIAIFILTKMFNSEKIMFSR